MEFITWVLTLLDPWLIGPYRWPSSSTAGYVLGTAILGLQCAVLGDFSSMGVMALNRKRLKQIRGDMDKHRELSETALKMGDKESYKALNRQALDAFGHSFSLGAAIFCVSIWPVPFGLAWMNLRFSHVELDLPVNLPLLGSSMDYFTVFLLLYIPVRIFYSRFMIRFSRYRRLKLRLSGQED